MNLACYLFTIYFQIFSLTCFPWVKTSDFIPIFFLTLLISLFILNFFLRLKNSDYSPNFHASLGGGSLGGGQYFEIHFKKGYIASGGCYAN